MPILKNAKTTWVSDEPWSSPDGKVKIWTIKLEVDGQADTHSTMSKALATMGWTGDVEVYTNAKGKDYVRQAPKEEQASGSRVSSNYTPNPEQQESIARSVALKAAVDYYSGQKPTPSEVTNVAERFLDWLTNSGSQAVVATKPVSQTTNVAEKPQSAAPYDYDADITSLMEQGQQLPPDDVPGDWQR